MNGKGHIYNDPTNTFFCLSNVPQEFLIYFFSFARLQSQSDQIFSTPKNVRWTKQKKFLGNHSFL